jgi:hypothetical protein
LRMVAQVSSMWVALIAGGMHSSLGFIYEPQVGTDLSIYPSDSWPWLGSASDEGGAVVLHCHSALGH